jgi:hypothetical protein
MDWGEAALAASLKNPEVKPRIAAGLSMVA